MERRPYGPTGQMVSVIGLGGIVIKDLSQEEATRIVHRAFDLGVNYFDVGPQYGDPEVLLGPALSELPRSEYFLACKSNKRDYKSARAEYEESARRLKVDYFDLYQLHCASSEHEVETSLASDGALKLLRELKQAGKTRHLGFSTHTEHAGLKLLDAYDFDSALFPVNSTCILSGSFGAPLLDRCREKGVTPLALKSMARTSWGEDRDPNYSFLWYEPETDRDLSALQLRFTLDQGVAAAIPPGHPDLFFHALDVAEQAAVAVTQ